MTASMSLIFLRGQARYMREQGFEVHTVTSPGEELATFAAEEGAATHAMEMSRRITPLRDMAALLRLMQAVRTIRPTIVHAHTPKGGLLGMLAARLCGVPVLIYHIRGFPFMTAAGLRRLMLKWPEWVACRLADRVLCVSHSLRGVAIDEGVVAPERVRVLGGGSGNGVDAVGRFNPDAIPTDSRRAVRERHGIAPHATVVGFVGRLVRDKGVLELAGAWKTVSAEQNNIHLLIVGPREERDAVPRDVLDYLEACRNVTLAGAGRDMPQLYSAMDLVVLPTFREGFPNVPLEAAAMRLPVVATRVPGCVDAVSDGETGTLVQPGDATSLARAMQRYIGDPELRLRHGIAGRERVLKEFRREVIWEALLREYRELLAAGSGRAAMERSWAGTVDESSSRRSSPGRS
jgi:glycosyltransferase involved in cell wall biosynthesis